MRKAENFVLSVGGIIMLALAAWWEHREHQATGR